MSNLPPATPPAVMDPATANQHMRKRIDEALELAAAGGMYTTRTVADTLVSVLRGSDPELLTAWLDAHAADLVYDMMTFLERSQRSHARQVAGRSAFAAAVQRHANGEPVEQAYAAWLQVTFNVGGQKKVFGQMTRADCTAAAAGYAEAARRSAMQDAMLRAVARRLREGETVSDRWDDLQLGALWRRLGDGS